MNILLLNTLMEPGGAQKAMLSLAKGLENKGYGITIATMYDKDSFIPHFEHTVFTINLVTTYGSQFAFGLRSSI